MNNSNKSTEKGFFRMIERVGNRLPHPVVLFIMLIVGIIAISEVVARMGVTVNYTDAAGENVMVEAVSLMTGDGLAYIFNNDSFAENTKITKFCSINKPILHDPLLLCI